jgi:hypothetical protein
MSAKLSNRTKLLATMLCGGIFAFGGLATSTIEASARSADDNTKTCQSALRTNKTKIEAAARARGGEARIKQIMAGAGCEGLKVNIARKPGGLGDDPGRLVIDCHFLRPWGFECNFSWV